MFLPKQVIFIIEKYGASIETKITDKVLPSRSNKELNVQLKIIGGMCKIPFPLTTHIARHSFRQLIAEAGITEISVIKRMMGHSRANDIDNVYYTVTESKLLDAKKKLESFLNKFISNVNETFVPHFGKNGAVSEHNESNFTV